MCLISCALSVYSSELDTLRHVKLDSIVVSSIKQKNNKWELPLSATTLTATGMQRSQLSEMKDFTGIIPNFIMIDRDSRLTSSVFVRGVGSLIGTPGVAMYVDGVPHFEKSTFDISLTNIESIEFLRGSQGTLYGRNAQGGIILVHTRSPFKHQGTTLNARYGLYNETSVALSHLNKLGDVWGYAFSGNYNHNDGFIVNKYLNRKADKINDYSINGRLEWRPSTTTIVKLTNGFQYSDQGAFAYGDINMDGQRVDSVSMNRAGYYNRKLYDGGLQIDYRNNTLWLRSNTSFQFVNDKYGVDQDASPNNAVFVIQSDKQQLLAQEITLRPMTESRYQWHFGVFAFAQHINRNVSIETVSKKIFTDKNFLNNAKGFAFYHQSGYNITPNLTIEAGIRYDLEKISSNYTYYKQPISGETKLEDELNQPLQFSNITPKISLQYRMNSNNQLYVSATKGFKAGGFNTSFEKKEQFNYDDEQSWTYETGTKLMTPSRNIQAEIALFYIDIMNPQVKRSQVVGYRIVNAEKSNSKGCEISLQANAAKNLSLSAQYGYTFAKFETYIYQEKTDKKEKIDCSGNYIPFVPRHTFSVGLDYTFPLKWAFCDRIHFHADYKGVGNMYWNELNTAQQKYYGLLNANVMMHKNKTTFSIWGKNLTDADYLGYYFEMGERKLGKPGRPISIGISLSQSF